MRALTIRQPWASLIATGHKDVENRTRRTKHRGEIAIHGGLTVDWQAKIPTSEGRQALQALGGRQNVWEPRHHVAGPGGPPTLACGAVIAVAEIAGCCECDGSCSPWAIPGQFHWQLANVRALDRPVPATGRLGLLPLPYEVEAAVRGQLAGDLTAAEMRRDVNRIGQLTEQP